MKASDATNGGHVPLTGQNTLGLILAGGQARRLDGQPKGLLPFAGITLLEHVRRNLCAGCDDIALGLPHNDIDWQATAELDGLLPIRDREADQGPLAALHAASAFLRKTSHAALITAPWDCPFLPNGLVAAMIQKAVETGHSVIAADEARTHPSVALWLRDDLEQIAVAFKNGERRLHKAAMLVGAVHAAFPLAFPPLFFNVNTPDDLRQLQQWDKANAGA
jgi:molybdenum cofactor guanylyltransferase